MLEIKNYSKYDTKQIQESLQKELKENFEEAYIYDKFIIVKKRSYLGFLDVKFNKKNNVFNFKWYNISWTEKSLWVLEKKIYSLLKRKFKNKNLYMTDVSFSIENANEDYIQIKITDSNIKLWLYITYNKEIQEYKVLY